MPRRFPKGFSAPLTPDGRAGIIAAPPWHYCGDLLIVEYRTDPDAVIALLPKELEPADDPGAVAAIFADWQSCSDDRHELVDPIEAQYREFFLVVGCRFQGTTSSRCVYIWVDKDFAMFRGWVQGFPKRLGSIHMTRTFPIGKAAPRDEAGATFGATCTAGSHEIARARVTLRRLSPDGPTVNAPTMRNTRHFPAFDRLTPAVFELVEAGGQDREITPIWEGDAELTLGANTIEPLWAIAPREIIKGFRFTFAYTVNGGKVVAQHDREAHR